MPPATSLSVSNVLLAYIVNNGVFDILQIISNSALFLSESNSAFVNVNASSCGIGLPLFQSTFFVMTVLSSVSKLTHSLPL